MLVSFSMIDFLAHLVWVQLAKIMKLVNEFVVATLHALDIMFIILHFIKEYVFAWVHNFYLTRVCVHKFKSKQQSDAWTSPVFFLSSATLMVFSFLWLSSYHYCGRNVINTLLDHFLILDSPPSNKNWKSSKPVASRCFTRKRLSHPYHCGR